MSIETASAVFNPADFGIKRGQWWAGAPHSDPEGGTRREIWEVLSAAPGRVHIKHGNRTKVVCPFVLAFTYNKAADP